MNLIIENKLENESLESNSEEEFSDDSDDSNSDNETDEITENIDENQSVEPEKKKRGRKKKFKDETLVVEKIQKKRGRKPKIKEIGVIVDKIPKKRGRKPKEKIYSVKELPKTFFEENKNETFILHLPIKTTDKNNSNSPLPNMNNDMSYSIYDENMNNYNINNNNLLLTQLDLLENNENLLNNQFDISSLIFDNEKVEIYEKKENNITTIIKKEEVNEDEIKTNRVIKKNLRNIMYEFINSNNERSWPESTNIYCWWCCHQFTGIPCAIPEYYKKDKFYVSGCFCSFNCSASYSFSKNDNNIWERYSLLNLMYKQLYNQKFTKISLAPPREVLKIFGGYMSIDEFRENSLKNDKTFTVIKPPLISVIPKIEENISTINKNLKNNISIINENILNKTHNNLKLKRNKPVTNPNSTLQSFMDLKIM